MASDAKPQLLNFVIDRRLLSKIDDFRFEHRFPSRAAAIKWLLEWSLSQNPKPGTPGPNRLQPKQASGRSKA